VLVASKEEAPQCRPCQSPHDLKKNHQRERFNLFWSSGTDPLGVKGDGQSPEIGRALDPDVSAAFERSVCRQDDSARARAAPLFAAGLFSLPFTGFQPVGEFLDVSQV